MVVRFVYWGGLIGLRGICIYFGISCLVLEEG